MNNNMTNKWNLIKLEEITEQTNFRNKQNAKHIVLSVTNSQGLIPSEKYFDKQVYSKDVTTYKIIKKGEIAYNPSRINVGSIALLNNYEMALVSPLYITLKTKKILEPRYLIHYLKSDKGIALIQHFTSGSVRDSLKYKSFGKIRIPLPPLETQKKIADVLDKAQELIDKRKKQLELLDEFLQSVFIDMFGDPVTNPKGWNRGKIRDVVSDVRYGTSKKAHESIGFYPILRMNNITYNGHWDFKDLKYIDLSEKELDKYLVYNGDILFNRTNSKELVGKTAVYKEKYPMAYAGYLIRVRVNEKVVPDYISHYLNSRYGKLLLMHICKNIVGMANINAQELQNIDILIPPLVLQNKFAEIVQATEKQRELMEKSLEEMENNFNSISQKAFRGELFS